MSDSLQEIRSQLEQGARHSGSSTITYLLRMLKEVETQISEIPEGDTAYRNELNLLYKERDVINDMLGELYDTRSSQNSASIPDHEEELIKRVEKRQAERDARLDKLRTKVDAFINEVKLRAFSKKLRKLATIPSTKIPKPEYGK